MQLRAFLRLPCLVQYLQNTVLLSSRILVGSSTDTFLLLSSRVSVCSSNLDLIENKEMSMQYFQIQRLISPINNCFLFSIITITFIICCFCYLSCNCLFYLSGSWVQSVNRRQLTILTNLHSIVLLLYFRSLNLPDFGCDRRQLLL